MSRFPHHISDLGLFTIFGYIDERHGDLPRHSAEQKSNNSKLPSENLAGVGRSKTARGKIVNSGTGAAGRGLQADRPEGSGRKLQAGETGAARAQAAAEGARQGQTQAADKCEVARTEPRKNGEGPP